MKILFLTNIPSPYRINFFNELGKTQELEVIFEAEKAPIINNDWYSNNIIENFRAVFLKEGEIEENKFNWKVLKYLKKNDCDIRVLTSYAYFTEMLALIYLKIKRVPYYLEVDGGILKNETKLKKKFKTLLISGAQGYISPSKQTDDYLCYYGAPENKIYRYSFTSLKEEEILKETITYEEKKIIRDRLGIREDKVILSVGQFIHRKGYDILLKSLEDIEKDIGVYIIGGKPTKEYLELKEKYSLCNVHFLDFKSNHELRDFYKAADVFVLPTREDVWGLVVNEAMAFGLPVITTTSCVAGVELIEHGVNGYLVAPNNSNELNNAIKYIIRNQQLLNDISKNNIEKIRNYTIEKMVQQHIDIFVNKSEL